MAHIGFKKLEGQLKGKVDNPGAVAASIGRKKYGAKKMATAAAQGDALSQAQALKK